jgi:UDP-4-keto-D-QuiNAc 4-reductase
MWLDVDNASVLITGATGFVGNRLAQRMVDEGFTVASALRKPGQVAGVVVGEINGETDWKEAVSGVDIVIHLAARVHVMHDLSVDPLAEYRKTNLEGTMQLARAAVEHGVKRFIYLSSIKVNGEIAGMDEPFTEAGPAQPQDAYALSKWEAEQALVDLSQKTRLEVVIVRPPLVYGPGVKGNFYKLLQVVAKQLPLPLGSVRNRRSLLALENLIDFIVLCAKHPKAANELFLLADEEALSTPELIRRIAAMMDKRTHLIRFPLTLLKAMAFMFRKQEIFSRVCESLVVDVSKAQELLGWSPPVSMEQELKRTIVAHNEAMGDRK